MDDINNNVRIQEQDIQRLKAIEHINTLSHKTVLRKNHAATFTQLSALHHAKTLLEISFSRFQLEWLSMS